MTKRELRHELRALLRLLAQVMRDQRCHRRMRHAIMATTHKLGTK
jgi:hypothetical protein